MNVTLALAKNSSAATETRGRTKHGVIVTLPSKLREAKKINITQASTTNISILGNRHDDSSLVLDSCCKKISIEKLDTETDLPKKYTPLKRNKNMILQLNEQVIRLPTDFSLLKTNESSAKQYNGSIWNIDSPVNRLY